MIRVCNNSNKIALTDRAGGVSIVMMKIKSIKPTILAGLLSVSAISAYGYNICHMLTNGTAYHVPDGYYCNEYWNSSEQACQTLNYSGCSPTYKNSRLGD